LVLSSEPGKHSERQRQKFNAKAQREQKGRREKPGKNSKFGKAESDNGRDVSGNPHAATSPRDPAFISIFFPFFAVLLFAVLCAFALNF
jgi:hypothetical protein